VRDELARGEDAVARRPQRLQKPRRLDRRSAPVLDRHQDDEEHHPDPDQDVADRKHVRQREFGGQGEDVAEEAEPPVADEDVLVHPGRDADRAGRAG